MTEHADPRQTEQTGRPDHRPVAPFATAIGQTRFVVLVGVVAVLLIAATLFLHGAGQAVWAVWLAVQGVLHAQVQTSSDVTVEFLEIVSTMLKAVVFYLIGVGLYSLFIAPLNLPVSLGVETLNDLESKVVSVIVVIMAITFLEHFITWQQPAETLQFGAAFALVAGVLVLFQYHAHRAREELTKNSPAVEERAQVELFSEGHERSGIDREQYREALESGGTPDGRASAAKQSQGE